MSSVPVTVDSVRESMETFAMGQVEALAADRFEVGDDDRGGVTTTIHRAADAARVRLRMTDSTEVFMLSLGGLYESVTTAYEDEEKWESLHVHFDLARLFLSRSYEEDAFRRGRRIVFRTISLADESGGVKLSTSGVVSDLSMRLFGDRITVPARSADADGNLPRVVEETA